MGLTKQSTGAGIFKDSFNIEKTEQIDFTVALAGNPNVGKSTVFNSLTGLNQHTGNWPGKTVTNAQGRCRHKNKEFLLVDLPGTYSLMANSVEEEVARDYICFGKPDAVVVVADATCLERNLNLVLQILEITNRVVVCVNLIDEAKRKKIEINLKELSKILRVPVIGTNARKKEGLFELMDAVYKTAVSQPAESIKITYDKCIEEAVSDIQPFVDQLVNENIDSRWVSIKLLDGDKHIIESLDKYLKTNLSENEVLFQKTVQCLEKLKDNGLGHEEIRDVIVGSIINKAEDICVKTVSFKNEKYSETDRKIDSIITSKIFGFPIMILLLGIIFWLTITGANYPSQLLGTALFWVEDRLTDLFVSINAPMWLHGIVVLGMYRTFAWVVSVMLPPMAIFFPLFTLLEDLGYLPRIAFNLDNFFKKACACGKQALTMCMGFGCNAAGVIGCRIINSPRERLIAIITNNFVPCNGRFPTLIAISTIFIGGIVAGTLAESFISTAAMTLVIIIGIITTLFISKLLSKTILKGVPSSFTLELPPYRKPQIGRIIVRSILDRTIFVLARAAVIALPAGIVIWIMANITIADASLLKICADFLAPFARMIGLDGYILMAFILGFPANEIVIPIIIMSYTASGSMLELDSLNALRELLVSNGWTWVTAVCVMLFSLMHFPCGTTLWTIYKETKSRKWTFVSFLLPVITGIIVCFVVKQVLNLFL